MSAAELLVRPPIAAVAFQSCRIDPLPASWPLLPVLVWFRTPEPAGAAAHDRAAASGLARQMLRQHAGPAMVAQLLQQPRHLRGAQSVSVSHDSHVSLLAWCGVGAVGVDVVALGSLAHAGPQELVATAKLYLGPCVASSVAAEPHAKAAQHAFAMHWACMEARLKCLGLELDEWGPARAQKLASVDSVHVNAVDGYGKASRQWVGCVAWSAQGRR